MVRFKALIEQFREKGEKTGWTFIEIPLDFAEQLMPGNKKTFRVRGKLDNYAFKGIALLPMGEGNFIMALNAQIRKGLGKAKGATVMVEMERDTEVQPLSEVFLECLEQDPVAHDFYKSLPGSHQRYYSNWIEAAKTELTKTKRIAQAIMGLAAHLSFGDMIKSSRRDKTS
jgi:hypothetical protein